MLCIKQIWYNNKNRHLENLAISQHSILLSAVKSSRVISHVNMELQSSISETVSVSIIRVDVMSGMITHCIHTHI